MTTATQAYGADLLDFAPDILRLQREPPSPLPRLVLYTLVALLTALLIWSLIGRLDIIAVAPGKLVPVTYVKVVQPATAGIIKELLVRDGDPVKAGQVLVRLDPGLVDADGRQSATQLQLTSLALRRIDAEPANEEPRQQPGDSPELFGQMLSQYRAIDKRSSTPSMRKRPFSPRPSRTSKPRSKWKPSSSRRCPFTKTRNVPGRSSTRKVLRDACWPKTASAR